MTREELLARAKESMTESELPAHMVDHLVTYLHNHVYWPEFEKLQSERSLPKRSPRSGKARSTSPITSRIAAAMQASDKSGRLYRAILGALNHFGPLTDDELRIKLRPLLESHSYAPESVTMRRGELRDAGMVRDSGEVRSSDLGAPMKVWEAVQPVS